VFSRHPRGHRDKQAAIVVVGGKEVCGHWLVVIEARRAKPREVYQPLRVALTGGTVSPGIFESVALLGRQETLRRIERALGRG